MNDLHALTADATADVAVDNPYLDIDLDGVQLIEASAGTGKTFTLVTLITRLVVERDLRLGQILAVTFTEAATQELRARLRKRLVLAADIADAIIADGMTADAMAVNPDHTGSGDPETALIRSILQRQLQREEASVLRARLRRAEHEIDLAAVFTIHGFCTRALGEHALQTGHAFEPTELIGSEHDLHDEVAADLWRAHGADARDAELLHVLWSGPDALAKDLGALLRAPRLLPPRSEDTPDPLPALQRAFDALCAAFARDGAQARADLDAAIAAKRIDGRKARAASYEKAWHALAIGVAGAGLEGNETHLDKLTPARMRECARTGCEDALPASPLFDALANWFALGQVRQQWLADQSLLLLHRIRDEARQRIARLKRARRVHTYDDLIDDVADALDGTHGEALATSLRAQYAIALVDEFQDTDPRQWAIFRRVFACGNEVALFLIGDPKQAIYGFRGGDVHTYLSARRDAVVAPPLAHNFRSRPGVLRALQALYAQAGEDAFVDTRIRFHPVAPGADNDDADYQRAGGAAAALTLRLLPAADDGKPYKADASRALATMACVAEIHAVLADARAGRATIDGQPVQPGDIAVLVRSHVEAARIQAALAAAGIPAVAAGKQSLFETRQAGELLAVFEALLHPAEDGRLRAALATVLLGVDGAGIDRLDHDDAWRAAQQAQAQAWRERWQRHGPLALVSDLCADNAERLLGLVDGERRLTNLMQLGEQLQEADARALGLQGLVDWLRSRIAQADANDEQQLLRLESDARRVQILTLHKSKGLEFGLVFLPFVGIGRKSDKPARHCQVFEHDQRTLLWNVLRGSRGREGQSVDWDEAVSAWQREQRAEDARLLYVGLTRARHALWLAHGPLYNAATTALSPMLADPDALRGHADIIIDARPLAELPTPLPLESASAVPAARHARRTLSRDWWIYSFSQLTNEAAGLAADVEGVAEEEPEPLLPAVLPSTNDVAFDRRFSGSRFGRVLHAALEHVDFSAWRNVGTAVPAGQEPALRAAFAGEGYPDADIEDGLPLLASLVAATLGTRLPEGVRLSELPDGARRAEMEFHFALQPTAFADVLALLHAHGVLRERHSFGTRHRLEGLMTGKIDLTYAYDGCYYLLDYKSNRLPAYDIAALVMAMDTSEYTLQALIYTLALHRWLRFRLGAAYDYARDFGGVRYLFCRGLDPDAVDAPGVHAYRPPQGLVEELDALFSVARAAA